MHLNLLTPPSDLTGEGSLDQLTDPISPEWAVAVQAVGDYFNGHGYTGSGFERLGRVC